jgi:sortase (surface protein transpeptidase)
MTRQAVTAVAALALALGLAGCAGRTAHWIDGDAAAAAGGQAGGGASPPAPVDPATAATATPQRVRIPDIDVDAVLEQLHLMADGSLGTPSDFTEAGWYADGTRPGETGPAVIAGHIDSTHGPAVFYRLDKLHAGALVEVLQDGRWLTFRVTEVARYPKNAFPTARVYGPTPDPQLRLITCGGGFDSARKSYLDNVVVYAVAA